MFAKLSTWKWPGANIQGLQAQSLGFGVFSFWERVLGRRSPNRGVAVAFVSAWRAANPTPDTPKTRHPTPKSDLISDLSDLLKS